MEKKLKIKELAEYYNKRYELTNYDRYIDKNNYDNAINTLLVGITRIIKSAKIGEKIFWDTIKPEKGSRMVSVEDFEKQCFKEWVGYLQKNYESCKDNTNFMQDKQKNHIYDSEDEYWEDRVQSFTKNNDSFYENGGNDDLNEELLNGFPDNMVLSEDTIKRAYEAMLEALYDVFYEPFKWDMLKYDSEHKPIDNSYGTKYTREQIESNDRLLDYKNYIGKRKV